jgi:serine/threonine protein kinase
MSESLPAGALSAEVEQRVAEVVAQITDRLHAGEPVDAGQYLARHPELADRLWPLLAALDLLGRFASSADADTLPARARAAAEVSGALGDFRLLREVGRGGMGVVYEAEQVSLRRRVALKVLPFAATMDPRQLQRFHNEARAAAGLHHSHIVPVFFVGSERGVHFYAMQLIEGVTVAALITELRREAAGEPAAAAAGASEPTTPYVAGVAGTAETPARASLSTEGPRRGRAYYRTVAGLGVQAAEALDYAHERGVVHRDIKPGNLMLDMHGALWVTDFGLAHLQQAEGSLTLTGDLVGTLRYMSPEQALAKRVPIDHRTDVYSLGATLYELLTLRPPFAGQDRQELLRQIAFEEPLPPGKISKAVPAELGTIVLKALEKSSADRYATAQDLADDLRRFLEDRPIQARRPTCWQRLRRWARRHQSLVWSAGVAAVLLLLFAVATLVVSNAVIIREMKEKERALEAARTSEAVAQVQQRLAGQNLRKACDAVDQMLNRVAEERLLHQPRMTATRRALLEDAARFYQEFARQGGNEPWVRLEAGRAYCRLASVLNEMGQPDRAVEASRHAISLLEQLRAEDSTERTYRWTLADAYFQLGRTLRAYGQPGKAEKVLRKAIDLCAQLTAEAPGEAAFRMGYAAYQAERSCALLSAHRLREAEEACRQALALTEKFLAAYPTRPKGRELLGRCQDLLGEILLSTRRFREAEPILRAALKTRRKCRAKSPADPNSSGAVAETLVTLAELLRKTGRLSEAQEAGHQALILANKLVEDFPAVLWHRNTQQHCLVGMLVAGGQPQEAEQLYQRAVAALERLFAGWPRMAEYRYQLARLHLERGRSLHWGHPKKAEQAYRRALPLAEQLEIESPETPAYRYLLVECRKELTLLMVNGDRFGEAEAFCKRTLPLAEKLAAELPDAPDHKCLLGAAYTVYGQALRGAGHRREAENAFLQAATVSEKVVRDIPDTPCYRLQAAFVQRELRALLAEDPGRGRDTEAAYRRELELLQKAAADFPTDPAFPEHLAHCQRLWGFFLRDSGRLEEVENAFRQAVAALEKLLAGCPGALPRHRVLLGDTYACLGSVLAAAGRRPEALAAMRKALELPPTDAGDCNHLAWVLATCSDPEVGDGRRAVELARKAVEQAPDNGNYWSTLGVAYCRIGDWKGAIEALKKSNALVRAGAETLTNAFCLAIAHWHLGNKEQARHWYGHAVAGMEKHVPQNADLRRLRAETEKSLGKPKMLDGQGKSGR